MFGFSGGHTGKVVKRLLDEEGLDYSFVQTAVETRICQTILPDGSDEFTELVEDSQELPARDWRNAVAEFSRLSGEFDIVVVSGTLPAHTPTDIYAELVRSSHAPVILDTSGPSLEAALEKRPAMVKINAAELHRTLRAKGDIAELAAELVSRGAGAAGITQGPEEAVLACSDKVLTFSVPDVEAVSALGSGDAVNAGIAYSLSRGSTMQEAFVFGLACGAANAATELPGVIDPKTVAELAVKVKAI